MIYQLSTYLTSWFIKKGIIKQEDFDLYIYCIDSLLAKFFFYFVVIFVSCTFHIVAPAFFYYLGFLPYRYTAGGYHAKSETRCSILSWSIFGISMYSITWIGNHQLLMLPSLFLVFFSTMIAWCIAPQAHTNKPVSINHKKKLRKICLVIQFLFILLIVLLLFQHYYKYAFSISLGNGIAGIFLLIAYLQKERVKKNEENLVQSM